jgi:hypothetical protein
MHSLYSKTVVLQARPQFIKKYAAFELRFMSCFGKLNKSSSNHLENAKGNSTMTKVRLNKSELLAIIKKNRAEHRDIFTEALEGYKQKMLALLNEMIDEIKKGKRVEHMIRLVQPTDQTKEYDRAIRMLEMSVDDIVELDEETFANLVLDDWSWSHQFYNSNAQYSMKAASKLL